MQPLGRQHMHLDQLVQRLQDGRTGADLVGERRDAHCPFNTLRQCQSASVARAPMIYTRVRLAIMFTGEKDDLDQATAKLPRKCRRVVYRSKSQRHHVPLPSPASPTAMVADAARPEKIEHVI